MNPPPWTRVAKKFDFGLLFMNLQLFSVDDSKVFKCLLYFYKNIWYKQINFFCISISLFFAVINIITKNITLSFCVAGSSQFSSTASNKAYLKICSYEIL